MTTSSPQPPPLAGKAIVITGAGRGLGKAYAKAAAEAGASVVVNDIDAVEAERTAAQICDQGGMAIADGSSVATAEGAEALIDRCVSRFGGVDGLVTNAAIIYYQAEPWRHTAGELERILGANVFGTIYPTLYALKRMQAAGRGSVVIVSSSSHLGIPGVALYGASKGAVTSFLRCVNRDLEGSAIRINGISPGAATRMTAGTSVEGAPEDIAPLVVYLLSELSQSVRGEVFRFYKGELGLAGRIPMGASEFAPTWTVDSIKDAVEQRLIGAQR